MERNRTTWIRAVALLAVALFLWLGCHKLPVNGPIFVHAYGTVLDQNTRIPIDSAWIGFQDSTSIITHTDTLGSFFTGWLRTVPEVTLFAGKAGYLTSSKVLKDIDHDTSGIVFELVRAL